MHGGCPHQLSWWQLWMDTFHWNSSRKWPTWSMWGQFLAVVISLSNPWCHIMSRRLSTGLGPGRRCLSPTCSTQECMWSSTMPRLQGSTFLKPKTRLNLNLSHTHSCQTYRVCRIRPVGEPWGNQKGMVAPHCSLLVQLEWDETCPYQFVLWKEGFQHPYPFSSVSLSH